MRRGYLRGLVIGGIIGLALGKMLKYKESLTDDMNKDSNKSANRSRFHEDKDFFNTSYKDDPRHLYGGFDEKEYEEHFSQYNHEDEDEYEYEYEYEDDHDELSPSMVLENYDGSETPRTPKRKKTARTNFQRRKKMGSLDE